VLKKVPMDGQLPAAMESADHGTIVLRLKMHVNFRSRFTVSVVFQFQKKAYEILCSKLTDIRLTMFNHAQQMSCSQLSVTPIDAGFWIMLARELVWVRTSLSFAPWLAIGQTTQPITKTSNFTSYDRMACACAQVWARCHNFPRMSCTLPRSFFAILCTSFSAKLFTY
jgi:hypothetical protein